MQNELRLSRGLLKVKLLCEITAHAPPNLFATSSNHGHGDDEFINTMFAAGIAAAIGNCAIRGQIFDLNTMQSSQ